MIFNVVFPITSHCAKHNLRRERYMKHWLIFQISLFLLAACSQSFPTPSEADIQTAIAQTQAANPISTNSPEPTITLTPTATPTETPTNTPTNTPTPTDTPTVTLSPTPTQDLRVIKEDPEHFLLLPEDLPEEAYFHIPGAGYKSPHRNSEIISGWGREKGLEYIEKSGRVDGWWVVYQRGTDSVRVPEEVFHNIIMYETVNGAQLTILEYNRLVENFGQLDWSEINQKIDVGDLSILMERKIMQPSGKNRVTYRLETSYRNYVSIIETWGWEDDITYEFLEQAARVVIAKLEAAPLHEP